MKIPNNVSESVKRLNPHLYPALGGLASQEPQSTPAQTLVRPSAQPKKRKRSVDAVITLIACRRRLLDDDNNTASFKPLRDQIAETIGIDDGDNRIRFEHEQIETRGRQGTIVKVERNNQHD